MKDDWKKMFGSLYPVNEELSEFDPGGWLWWKKVQPEIKKFIEAVEKDAIKTGKSRARTNEHNKVLDVVDRLQKSCAESDGLIDGVTALHKLRTKLAQLKGEDL